ncbi:D-aminoacyl-tRNA deacylase [uncultured archaeon]|nr:D-aminoacyl-tRNA deacylase [uncultured archaeon]
MYKNFLIVASKIDTAGINITTQMSQFGNFNFYLIEDEMIYTENLNLEKMNQYDFIIFASKHQSEKGNKTISIHAPGNWRKAELGGQEGRVCKTSALFQKQIFEKLKSNMDKFHIKDYELTLECTHHGPLIKKPCLFVQIGATEKEWKDRKAGFIVAKSIAEIISEFKENPYNEVAIGIGGPHYCPNFNKIQLNSNVAISHVIPQYALPLTQEMVQEAIAGTDEDIDLILLDWKGLGNAEQRKQITDVLDKFYIQKKRTSEISK